MAGLGYGHPTWGHGLNHGALAVEREGLDPGPTSILRCPTTSTFRHSRLSAGRARRDGSAADAACWSSWRWVRDAPSGFTGLLDLA